MVPAPQRPQRASLFLQRQPRNFSSPGDKQPSTTQGEGGAAREGSPDIPRQQRRTLPAAVRERDRSSGACVPSVLPKGTLPSALPARSPHRITARARTLLPLPRRSPRARTAPGPSAEGGAEPRAACTPLQAVSPQLGTAALQPAAPEDLDLPGTLSRRGQESTGWPDRDQHVSGLEPEHSVGLAHEQECP